MCLAGAGQQAAPDEPPLDRVTDHAMAIKRLMPLMLAFALAGPIAWADGPKITRADLEPIFTRMRQGGWNVDGPLLWSYFFASKQGAALGEVRRELETQGYVFVTSSSHRNGVTLLQMDRIETHTVASLDLRNREFYVLAARHPGVEYDGMEAGRLSR
jgi:hypothetical protein